MPPKISINDGRKIHEQNGEADNNIIKHLPARPNRKKIDKNHTMGGEQSTRPLFNNQSEMLNCARTGRPMPMKRLLPVRFVKETPIDVECLSNYVNLKLRNIYLEKKNKTKKTIVSFLFLVMNKCEGKVEKLEINGIQIDDPLSSRLVLENLHTNVCRTS